ncbi:MAG: hypothetical protein U1G07_16560 [Verrucomicrobiota bacterium]
MKNRSLPVVLLSSLLLTSVAWETNAQITNTLFADDFSGTAIDATKYAVDSPFFEGGKGDIAPKVESGVLEFTGTVSQQWWAGGTLRLQQPFVASPETNLIVSVDRVAEQGEGTASRSALWIMDETRTKYVLYAEVRGEGGWHFNRYIGEAGDVRTGGGTDIVAFNGVDAVTGIDYDDQGLHRLAAVLNGSDIKLYLDGKFGTTVKFPFSPVVLQLGSYARANDDTAHTIWDNLQIDAVGTVTFSLNALTLGTAQTATLTVRIPPGANATKAVPIQILNQRPTVAVPAGATGGNLTLTFEPGGSNTKTFDLQGLAIGSSQLSLTNNLGLLAGNSLLVTVVKGPTVVLEDDFASATLDPVKWRVNDQSFETGTGTFEVAQPNGTLRIAGSVVTELWPGASVQTVGDFNASKDLPLVFEVDRVSMEHSNVSGTDPFSRSGVFITSYDTDNHRTGPWVFFGQNLGETGWEVNLDPGSPTGSGTAVSAFTPMASDTGKHRIKLRADGSEVEVFLDDVSGGKFAFPAAAFIRFELAAFARGVDDAVTAVFDNVKAQNVLPCISVAPSSLLSIQGDTGDTITVTIPKLLNVTGPAVVTVTSHDPNVAEPAGAVNGSLSLTFPTGTSAQSFKVNAKSAGTTTFDLSNDKGACVDGGVSVAVTAPPVALLSDDFAGTSLDTAKWSIDTTPLVEGGAMTAESVVTLTNGQALLDTTTESGTWPGFTVLTTKSYSATADSPVVFEIDRTKMEYTLVGGDTSKQRTGIWVRSGTNYVFFSDFGSYNATLPGWQFHRAIGSPGDVLLGDPDATGTYISAFAAAKYTDQKTHRLRIVANGATVKLYLDGVLGPEILFPFGTNLVFGFGAYANLSNGLGNPVKGYFDNALVQGFPAQPPQPRLSLSRQGANIVLTWTGSATLETTDSLTAPVTWTAVTPAPTGSTYTVAPSAGIARFYRLRQ